MNTKRVKPLLTKGNYTLVVDEQSAFGTEYAVVHGYKPESKSWNHSLIYTTNMGSALIVMGKRLEEEEK